MRLCLSIACILFAAVLATAQSVAAPASGGAEAIIHSETRVVLVDAVAVDKKNRFIRDLTGADFKIREDGKEQKITSFSLESAGLSPERSTKHYIVLFFDTSTLSASTLLTVRRDATQFVDAFASPDRYMAVIAYGAESKILQNFTADPARLKNALSLLQSFSAFTSAPATANTGGRGGRGNANGNLGEPWRRMLASLRTVADSMGGIRGRKALVLFSGGASAAADLSAALTDTINACNQANVAVYGVNALGLIGDLNEPGPGRFGPALLRAATQLAQAVTGGAAPGAAVFGFQRRGGGATSGNLSNTDASGSPIYSSSGNAQTNPDVLRTLADGTGGLMLATSNDLPEALGRIAQEQDEYYLLGYTPAVESAEGTCHTLQVKVDRSGLDVRARKGYCTSKPVDLFSAKAAGHNLEERAAGNAHDNIALRMQLPWFYSGRNVARVSVAADIVPAAMQFQKEQDRLLGQFNLAGIAYNPDGSVAARFSDTVKLSFATQQEADAFLKTPYHYVNQFEIAPGSYDFRLAVSSGDKGFGKAALPLVIVPWNGETLTMSALALSHDAHAVADQKGAQDDLLLTRDSPLISNGMEVIPTGTSGFRVGERGFFYFELYAPPLRQRQIAVRVRILDRATGRQLDDSGPMNPERFVRPGDPVIPIAMSLPIVSAGLPAGAYKLEVTVDAIVRTADFDVN